MDEGKVKDILPSSNSKSELFIITPEELQRLGLLKGAVLTNANSNTIKSKTEGIQTFEKTNLLNDLVQLNSQDSNDYLNDTCKNSPSEDSRDSSDKVNIQPEVLNSKVCLPIMSDVGGVSTTIKADSVEVVAMKIPRKRGRPRKQPVGSLNESHRETSEKDFNVLDTTNILEESKTGRKRRKVDYFAMENNMYELEVSQSKNKRKKLCSSSSDNGIAEKIDNTNQKVVGNSTKNFEKRKNTSKSSSSDDDQPLINKNKLDNTSPKYNSSIENISILKEDNDGITSINELEKTAQCKYKKTGETKKFMNSIFSAAFKITPKTETEEPGTKLEIPNVEFSPKRGRRKKYEESSLNFDINGNVTCIICQDKMTNNNWKEHNMNNHYNLSWREGEPPLRIDEESFQRKTLKPFLTKYKKLHCDKCTFHTNILDTFIQHREECLGIVLDGKVSCAICKEQIKKKQWILHKLKKHNNLAWRVGDKALDLNNQAYVLFVLNALYKAKKPLFCAKCNTSKKSVVGFLSHQAQCGIAETEAKIKCEYCSKLMLPVSMSTHIKMIHETPQNQLVVSAVDDPVASTTSRKRKAALDAMLIIDAFTKEKIEQEQREFYEYNLDFQKNNDSIRQVLEQELQTNQSIECKFRNCHFRIDEHLDLLLEHMNTCGSKPSQYYTCLRCLLVTLTEKDMIDHVRTAYKSELDIKFDSKHSEYDIDEQEELLNKAIMKRRRQDMTRLEKDSNCKVKPAFLCTVFKKNRSLFSSAFEYTLEFCNEHFTQSTIFNTLNYSPYEWQLLENEQMEMYLPKSELSCQVSRNAVKNIDKLLSNDETFKRYELFECQQDDGHTTIYCGGPISALAWLPTPHMYLQCKQVLAVVASNCFDAKYTVNSNYSEATSIQFWYFDVLKNKTKIAMPSLMFCLAVDIGPVWHLEWCPSGCYNEDRPTNDGKLDRMGLLAVAGSHCEVHIYAVPFLNQNQMELIYKVKPLLKLKLLEDEKWSKRKYFPTRISWSKASGHRHLAVGYTNGMVAMFDLETISNLLRFRDKTDVDILLPYHTIKAHKHYISVLSMIHLKGGTNWLLTGSFDRDIKLWDIKNNTNFTLHRKKIITDGAWFTNWLCHISTIDESATRNRIINATVSSHRHYMYDPVSVTSSASSITSVSTSDWLNGIIQGSNIGDISSSFPHQILYCLDNDKTIKDLKYFLGCTKLVSRSEVDKDAIEKPITYEAATKQYRLVFCDMKMDNYSDFSPKIQERFRGNCDILEQAHPNMYPIQAINKISFNPNCQASLYYATGYQAGFVRISYLKFLENDRQVV